ncbi:ester cyclase [Rhodopila sp.]|uniref:ester cyclase n=1 Tax=Rhodopila sp. TaxID=2480087 RepID=UPI003D0E31D5
MSNKEILQRLAATANAGDVDVAEWYTEDFKLYEPGVPLERVTGHEGARRMLAHLRTALIPETRFEILDMVEEDDRVAVRWLFSGKKEGHPVVMPCIAIYRFVDGRIAEDWGIACYEGHPWP